MKTFSKLSDLPLQIDRLRLRGLELRVSDRFLRRTTEVELSGGDHVGVGEDVNYEAAEQLAFQTRGASLQLSGTFTLEEFSAYLDSVELFSAPPRYATSADYRRWAFESAALDLALQQSGVSLAGRLSLEAQPVRFVASMGLGRPPSIAPLEKLLARRPGLEFKLDAASSWDAALIRQIVELAPVRVVDFKGAYRGTIVDQAADPALYARVVTAFPRAWLEDPHTTPECVRVLEPHRDRIAWDAPIHTVADIERLDRRPRMLNIKPSRFGTLRGVCDAYDYCNANAIGMYGGGQFELGIGRGQIQYLASLFHADGCNDVAPTVFHAAAPTTRLPGSPLPPTPEETGFRWA